MPDMSPLIGMTQWSTTFGTARLSLSVSIINDNDSYLPFIPHIAADAGSTYSPVPVLTYEWDPDKQPNSSIQPERTASSSSFELGPHPTDPHTSATYVSIDSHGQNACRKQVEGQEIYVYVEGNAFVIF